MFDQVMVVIKPRRIELREKGKRFKYSEGAVPSTSKLSGVKKTLLVGVLPFTQENYTNVKLILDNMKLGALFPTYSCDIKMDLYLIGRDHGACRHNCVFGDGCTPWTQKPCSLITVGEAKMWHKKFMDAGGEGTGKNFQNMIHEILLQYPDETYLIDVVNFPELHVMMGIVKRLVDYIKEASSVEWVEDIYYELNITQTFHGGKKGLNGNASKKLLEHATTFIVKRKGLPDTCNKDRIAAAAKTMSLFNAVVDSSFGNFVEDSWVDDIAKFCASFRALEDITFPPKYHMVESHLEQFLRRKWAQNTDYKGFGLGYWSEQQFEAVHAKFSSTWDRFKVGKDHEEFGKRLLDAAMSWDARAT